MISSFSLLFIPKFYFGSGSRRELLPAILNFGKNVLLITGDKSFYNSDYCIEILDLLKAEGIELNHVRVNGEPTVESIDKICKQYRNKSIDVVVSIGGGSVIDTGKAVSAMLTVDDSIENYLEGSQSFKYHPGMKLPFIAMPTTAGTGSEATKNAVIAKYGVSGFKRSLRHDNFIPDIAIIDADFLKTCPVEVFVASGLDALTQLIESYISIKSSYITDILSLEGLKLIAHSFTKAIDGDEEAQINMSMSAFLSGITLANSGLGVVHGFASSIGGLYNIPHGVICGTLLPAVMKASVDEIYKNPDKYSLTANKFIKMSALFTTNSNESDMTKMSSFIDILYSWVEKYKIPLLRNYGLNIDKTDEIINKTSQKEGPIKFSSSILKEILISRI